MTRLAAAALIVAAIPGTAGAVCNGFSAPEFGQLTPSCGGAYCYINSPPGGYPQTLTGSFWSFGTGAPGVGSGDDNGGWTSPGWLLLGSQPYLSGTWGSSPVIDGCINGHVAPGKPAEIMMVILSEDGINHAFFAAAAVRRHAGNSPEFDFTFEAGGGPAREIALDTPLPPARVIQAARPNLLTFGAPTLADVTAGLYSDGSLATGEMVTGYRIYKKLGAVVSRLRTDGWTAVTGAIPLGQNVTVTVSFDDQPYLAYSLVFDRGFESPHVGQYIHVQSYCQRTDLDGDGSSDLFGDPECCPIPEACDCNDANASIHPGAPELCNGIDDNCDTFVDNPPVPAAVGGVRIAKTATAVVLDWNPVSGAASYDLTRGDLSKLRQSSGDFAFATTGCVANDVAAGPVEDAENLLPGEGLWYLTRGNNCGGEGSYDTPDATQAGSRDFEIAASGRGCP